MQAIISVIIVSLSVAISGPASVIEFEDHTGIINHCSDNLPVKIDANSGTIYGDQNGDGILSGIDCDYT